MTETVTAPKHYDLFIDGEWVPSAGGLVLQDTNPADGSPVATVARGAREDARRAVDAAYAAREPWGETLGRRRADYLYRAYDILNQRRNEIIDLLVRESGATIRKATLEVLFCLNMLRSAAEECRRIEGETFPSDVGKFMLTVREPVGVVAAITPWNFPFQLPMKKVVHALAFGNTVVLKPASDTPVLGLVVAEIFQAVKLPKGVLNVVVGPGDEVGEELAANPKVRHVTFTGETETGRHIAEVAGRTLKGLTLELGGSDPLIVLRDADVEYAAEAAVYSAFFHQGENCVSAKRMIVETPIAERFIQLVVRSTRGLRVGDPRNPETELGPLINSRVRDRVHDQVEDARAKGARVECGGSYDGLFYQPTILTDVTEGMRVWREEVFGPARTVISVASADEALAVANSSAYGLSAGIMTNNLQDAWRLARKLQCGMVHINDTPTHDEAHGPFGGVKDSGLGREGGKYSMQTLTQPKWITIQLGRREYKL